ncbi:MAG TPA: DNA mismatch repair protein MutL, partial [Chitinophagaceae bacterium]
LQNEYILADNGQSLFIVHQRSAHECVVYEKLSALSAQSHVPSQPSMFPVTMELSPGDAHLLNELLPEFASLGYHIEPFGAHAFIIQGTPADLEAGNEKGIIELVIDQYKHFSAEIRLNAREKLMRVLARQQATGTGRHLSSEEMTKLLDELFACRQPNVTPDGRPTWIEFQAEQLSRMFAR